MGLDMYLISLPKIEGMDFEEVLLANGRLSEHERNQTEIYEKLKPHIKHFQEFDHSWTSLYQDIAYWRKANWIHNWFVENLHAGEDEPVFIVEVTKDQLEELHSLCVKVLMKEDHPSNILPTRPGCFFGNLYYNDFYFREIYETESLLAYLLENFNFETHYLMYQCSW